MGVSVSHETNGLRNPFCPAAPIHKGKSEAIPLYFLASWYKSVISMTQDS